MYIFCLLRGYVYSDIFELNQPTRLILGMRWVKVAL